MVTPRDIKRLRAAAGVGRAELASKVQLPANIVEFATGEEYLGLQLFPRQATLLKAITADVTALTDFDHQVLAEWSAGFTLDDDDDQPGYTGTEGIVPDVLDRMTRCREAGRPWFNEVALIIGRRGSKNFIATIVLLWRIWKLLVLGDPQAHYKLPTNKPLLIHVFGTDMATLRRNAFGDLVGLFNSAPCFAPFRGLSTATELTVLTPAQLASGARPGQDRGLIAVVAAATTFTSGRGAASPVLLFDEFAFLVGAGSTVSSTDIYDAASPAVMQFEDDGLIMQVSSPWEKTGQLYRSYVRGLAVDATTGRAKDPGTLVVQLPSWALYEGSDSPDEIPMWPGGPPFPALEPKIREAQVLALEAQGNDVATEYRAQFATALNAYLLPDRVNAIFGDWKGATLIRQSRGERDVQYVAHADPSRSNANFGFAIGHAEYDDRGAQHFIFDVLDAWRPQDFPGGIIDYMQVEDAIFGYLSAFPITTLTFDQYSSTQSIQQLNHRAQAAQLPWRPHIYQRPATSSGNWQQSEVFKTAVNLGVVHAPSFELARDELLYLVVDGTRVSHPPTGPVRTDDVADSMINVVFTLAHDNSGAIHDLMSSFRLHGTSGGGPPGAGGPGLSGWRGRRRPGGFNPARGFRPGRGK